MNTKLAPSSQVNDPSMAHRKRLKNIMITVCALVLLCGFVFCVLGVIGIVEGTKPKNNPVFYRDASIMHMMEACDPQRYLSWEDWMIPVSGHDSVISLNYSKSAPAPEAFYAYTLFIQVDPTRFRAGQELLLPSEDVQPFLLETRVPYMVCSGELTGTVSVLEVLDTSVRAQLDVTGSIYGGNWEYHGEVVFKQAPLPK